MRPRLSRAQYRREESRTVLAFERDIVASRIEHDDGQRRAAQFVPRPRHHQSREAQVPVSVLSFEPLSPIPCMVSDCGVMADFGAFERRESSAPRATWQSARHWLRLERKILRELGTIVTLEAYLLASYVISRGTHVVPRRRQTLSIALGSRP